VLFCTAGDYYWKLTDDGLAQGFPKSIAGTWSGLPGNIDAAFTYKNGKTYFFKGTKYWKYTDTTMDDGYPKDISDGFAGIPDNVDAALVWSGNGKIYFFKGWFCVTRKIYNIISSTCIRLQIQTNLNTNDIFLFTNDTILPNKMCVSY